MSAPSRYGARSVLALVVALQLVAETALTPYWPRLFRDLFGVEELAATGSYLAVCRLAGLVALPLWGLAARRWPLRRLLVLGLLGCAGLDLGLAVAPTLAAFTVLSAAVVATGASLVLAYPALVALVEERTSGDRVSGVVVFVAVLHAATVLATVVGAAVVALPEPRVGLALFATLDLSLALLVHRMVPASRDRVAARRGPARTAVPRPLAPLLAVVVAAVLLELGFAVTRPFLVELLLRRGEDVTAAALAYLAPSGAALVVVLAARTLLRRLGHRLAPVAAAAAVAGLVLQAASGGLGPFVAGRLLFGAALGVLMVAVDVRVFAVVGTGGAAFAGVETARSVALLGAPLLATAAASGSAALAGPLLVGAALMAGLGVLGLVRARPPADPPSTAPSPTQEDADAAHR